MSIPYTWTLIIPSLEIEKYLNVVGRDQTV